MARMEGTEPRGMFQRIVYFMMKRWLGGVPDPVRIVALSPPIFKGRFHMERAMTKLEIPPSLVSLTQLRTAQRIGCPF